MTTDRPALAVPGGRWTRLARLGTLATTVAGGMLAEGARQLARGERPKIESMLLTPANARRVTEELSRLRGAAMKVGQLLSMDAGDLIPPMLSDILSRLRADATPMPMSQLVKVLEEAWGKDWDQHFERFSFTPAAAASIGQVHQATTVNGTRLAIKVQYPGVRESIDSDVNNVAALLRLSSLLPSTLDIAPLLTEAKRQLHAEADYLHEGAWLERYAAHLGKDSAFLVPERYESLTTQNVLAMGWVDGDPVESLVNESVTLRNRVAGDLFNLVLQELFEFGVIQSDPNFANYRYSRQKEQLVLLDFGATREIPGDMAQGYRALMQAALNTDRSAMQAAAASIGYFSQAMTEIQCEQVLDLFVMACEPLCHGGKYDFGTSTLPRRMHEAGMALALDRDFWHTPPIDALFLHRKLAGTYLIASRLKAQVDIGCLTKAYL